LADRALSGSSLCCVALAVSPDAVNLKHRFKVDGEEAPARNIHGFKGYSLKQEQLAML
jgi:hypothetical protein